MLLRGYARAGSDEKLQRVEIRAMVDTGAQGEFMSPSLAKRLGATIEHGDFCVAIEAFGGETPLTKRARGVALTLPGEHPGSGLAQDFSSTWTFVLAPGELSSEYDLLLGQRFLRHFQLSLDLTGPNGKGCIRLTTPDGTTTRLHEDTVREECREPESEAEAAARVNAIRALSCAKPLTSSERREIRAALRDDDGQQRMRADRAARECPQLVMSLDELERLWHTATPGTVKVHAVFANGFHPQVSAHGGQQKAATWADKVKRATAPRVTVSRLAYGRDLGTEDQEEGTFLPAHERPQAEAMVKRLTEKEFPQVFPKELPALTPKEPERGMPPFEIKLKPDTQPFGRYGPRMTEANTLEAGKMIKELLEKGFIRPSRSPWGSPMFLVDKPDGTKRMVIDYRALNASTVRNRYPLPRVDELFDQLQGARYFSKIDLRTGYWQIRVAADDVAKTAFTSRHGHFEWLVLPMGLTNAPAEFMALMEHSFRDMLNKFVLVFLDDILVYSRTLEEHERHLRAVLQRLADQKLYGKLSKCQFARQEVEFLGHFVGRRGIRMVDGKVAAVENWPTPSCQKEVEQFVGLAGYYRRFIGKFSEIASPLTELCGTLRKDKTGAKRAPPTKPFTWGDAQQRAFEQLKEAVASAPCLAIPDPKREFIVHTDASGYATGAVLMQKFDEGLRPIAFLSRKMNAAERNYPVHEQELLAILNALKAWRHYLGGQRFTILTDHQSLQYVESSAMATPRQMRWAAWLTEFDFVIKYTPGNTNVVADALSRGAAGGSVSTAAAAGGAQDTPSEASSARTLIAAITALAPLPTRIRDAVGRDAAYLDHLARSDEELHTCADGPLAKADGLLYRVDGSAGGGQLVVPKDTRLRTYLLSAAHDTLGGHNGVERTKRWLQERVWWPKMAQAVESYVRGCESCQRNKSDTRGRQGLPLSIEIPRRAWDVICMDFMGPFPRTARGYDAVMVVVEKLTRWVYYVAMRTTDTAQEVFAQLNQRVLANHGTPCVIISDRDSRFTSRFWEHLWEHLTTELKRSTAFRPQTDGQTEQQNKTLGQMLRAYVDAQQSDWDILLPQLQLANNTSVCASTGFSPYRMLFGRDARTALDAELEADGVAARGTHPGATQLAKRISEAEEKARELIAKAQAKQRADSAAGRREVEIRAGDRVWLSNRNMRMDAAGRARKLEPLYWGPYEVLEMRGSNAAKLKLPDSCRLHSVFNVDLLRRYVDGRAEFPDRPVQDARPGPVPEEDPAAGGPGEPVYEAEAVTGMRRRNGARQYKVKWLGWPVEQSSWVDEADCEGCRELVDAYEQRLLELNALHTRIAAIKAESALARRGPTHATVSAAAMSQERAREAAVRAEADTSPLLPGAIRPPVMPDGQIRMGTQRCVAETKAKGQCRLMTRHGAHCWVHLAQKFGARIKPSTLQGAGKGLFAARDFRKGDKVARYTGDLIPVAKEAKHGENHSHYQLLLSEQGQGAIIDAARTNAAEGRMVNDARGSGQRNNCRFSCDQTRKTAVLRATRNIKKGEELFVNYGRDYWPNVKATQAQGDSKQKPIVINNVQQARTVAKQA